MKKIILCAIFLSAFLCGNAQKATPEIPKRKVCVTGISQPGYPNWSNDLSWYNRSLKNAGAKKNNTVNTSIQDIMTRYNQAENMAANTAKKKKDTKNGIRNSF